MRNSELSRRWRLRPLWETVGLAMVGVIVVLSLVPAQMVPAAGGLNDKVGHALSYSLAMGWYAQVRATAGGRAGWAIALSVLGGLLEVLQGQTETRHFEWADILADWVGVAAGWMLSVRLCPDALHQLDAWIARDWSARRV